MTKKGFTLMEILIALVIILVLLAIGIPQYRNMKANTELNLAADQLAADLRYTRQTAVSQGSSSINLNAPPADYTRGYTIYDSTGGQLKSQGLNNITISYPGSGIITFSSNGSTDIGGNIVFTSTTTGRQKTITVTQASGMIVLK